MDFFSDCKTQDEVKARFRQLAKMFHPDQGGDPSYMIQLQEQYDKWPKNIPQGYQSQNSQPYYSAFGNNVPTQIEEIAKYYKRQVEKLTHENRQLTDNLINKNAELSQFSYFEQRAKNYEEKYNNLQTNLIAQNTAKEFILEQHKKEIKNLKTKLTNLNKRTLINQIFYYFFGKLYDKSPTDV